MIALEKRILRKLYEKSVVPGLRMSELIMGGIASGGQNQKANVELTLGQPKELTLGQVRGGSSKEEPV